MSNLKPGHDYLDATLNATVTVVPPDGTCERCNSRPVTRWIEGGTYGDGSDWWEKFSCGICLRAMVREERTWQLRMNALQDERERVEAAEEAARLDS